MRTSPEFIANQRKRRDHTQFATYIRNHTDEALSLSVPFGSLDKKAKTDDEDFEILRDKIRAEVSIMPDAERIAGVEKSRGIETQALETAPQYSPKVEINKTNIPRTTAPTHDSADPKTNHRSLDNNDKNWDG